MLATGLCGGFMKRTSRKPSELSESVQRHLNAYALAASAAGVGMLALSQSEAKIVYTPTHEHIVFFHHPLALDLNHDGIKDFTFYNSYLGSTYTYWRGLGVNPIQRGNALWENNPRGWAYPYALPAGVRLERSPRFNTDFGNMVGTYLNCHFGDWGNVQNRYLGLRFQVRGRTHYGWARLSSTCDPHERVGAITARITGYAYETIPNKPIITGKTKGPDVITVEPGSLGALAAGASKPRSK
jgi:hypothetical protein